MCLSFENKQQRLTDVQMAHLRLKVVTYLVGQVCTMKDVWIKEGL